MMVTLHGGRFKELSEAYAILSDPQQRKMYDQSLAAIHRFGGSRGTRMNGSRTLVEKGIRGQHVGCECSRLYRAWLRAAYVGPTSAQAALEEASQVGIMRKTVS